MKRLLTPSLNPAGLEAKVVAGSGPALLSDNQPVMDALLRAIGDPGSILPRAPLESVSSWQRRAVLETAAPLIAAVQREADARLADQAAQNYSDGKGCGGDAEALWKFADLLRERTTP